MTNTLILAAGSNRILTPEGLEINKLSFQVGELTLWDQAIRTYSTGKTRIVLSSKTDAPEVKIDTLEIQYVENTQGALISALMALKDLDLAKPLIITPIDGLIPQNEFQNFLATSQAAKAEMALVVFKSDNSNYSYIRTLENLMIEVSEKKVISSMATAGIFYFSSAALFVECAEWSITNNLRTMNQFFIAPALNYAIVKDLKTTLFEIEENQYFRFSNYEIAIEAQKRYKNESY